MATYTNRGGSTAYTKPYPSAGFELGKLGGGSSGGSGSSSSRRAGGYSSGGGGGYAAVSVSAPAVDQEANLKKLIEGLYSSVFQQADVVYTPQTGDELGRQISEWLLPGYERAIAERKKDTARYGAELDADAIARGMGSSTFVTDVKNRQMRDEASDISTLQSEYGASLAKSVMEQMTAQQKTKAEVDMFNASMRQAAYQSAYEAALVLLKRGVISKFEPEDATA